MNLGYTHNTTYIYEENTTSFLAGKTGIFAGEGNNMYVYR